MTMSQEWQRSKTMESTLTTVTSQNKFLKIQN